MRSQFMFLLTTVDVLQNAEALVGSVTVFLGQTYYLYAYADFLL
jgi:hypothetical protein